MCVRTWLTNGISGLLIAGCGGMQTGPTPETKAALAPTTKLRVAFLSAAIYATKDPETREWKGVAIDLGKELARQLAVPFDPVVYATPQALLDGAKSREWDIALTGISPERAAVMDFSPPYMELEQGYLVRAGTPIATASDVDRPGVRVGVLETAGADLLLSKSLKHATLVRAKSASDLFALLRTEKADVVAIGKPGLFAEAPKHPGSRVLDGRIFVEPIAIGVPKGRDVAAASYVGKFVEQAKADGLVKSAIERAGLRGVVVAPAK